MASKSSIPLQRLISYLIALPLLPLLFYLPLHYTKQHKKLQELESYLEKVQQAALVKEKKQALNTTVRTIFSKGSPSYLDQLETMTFLKQEKEAIEKIMSTLTFPGNEGMEKRHQFLTSDANRLLFLEGSHQRKEGIAETLIALSHPVEMDTEDLKVILQKIEGREEKSPQLFFTDFKLHKKTLPSSGEVYEINMQLLKREYLP